MMQTQYYKNKILKFISPLYPATCIELLQQSDVFDPYGQVAMKICYKISAGVELNEEQIKEHMV